MNSTTINTSSGAAAWAPRMFKVAAGVTFALAMSPRCLAEPSPRDPTSRPRYRVTDHR